MLQKQLRLLGVLLLVVWVEEPKSVCAASGAPTESAGGEVRRLSSEVRDKGWIVFSAKTPAGNWDLFVSRPDASHCRNLTNTKDWNEAAPRFSPDGKWLLYRRIKQGSTISHDRWGFQGQLVIATSKGERVQAFGSEGEFPWAIWNSTADQLACLSIKGIQIIDRETMQVVRQLPRQGIFQQLFWSPDGDWLCGTANVGGERWTIVRMNARSGALNVVSKFQNCTPDWFPDSQRIIFSNRPGDQGGYGWTQLWMADAAGNSRRLVYGEDGRHIYGGAISPDGKYVIFTRCERDGGGSERDGAPGGLMRLSDAPIIAGDSEQLRQKHPQAKPGPVLPLPDCWEPHWTFATLEK